MTTCLTFFIFMKGHITMKKTLISFALMTAAVVVGVAINNKYHSMKQN